MGRVEGKVAFITGIARGQGRSHALRLAEEGASIVGIDACEDVATVGYGLATEDDLAETVKLVEERDRRIIARKADVRRLDQIQAVVDEGLSEFGKIDVVCANAGIVSYAPAWEYTAEAWQTILDVNLTGVWHTIKAIVPSMLERGGGGSIILTSSAAGIKGFPNTAAYTVSKHGVIGLMRTLAAELAPHFIRVNALCPTNVKTGMIENDEIYKLFMPDEPEPSLDKAMAIFKQMNMIPVGWVEAVDISNVVLFLASDESRYLTSVALPVDAGATEKLAAG